MRSVAGGLDNITVFDAIEEEKIKKLREEKYSTWEWNYGQSPKFSMTKEGRFTGGTVEVTLDVQKGCIENIRIYGDFFGTGNIHELEEKLIGVKHQEQNVLDALREITLSDYMVNVQDEELAGLLF
jgi:lipoate-protein ligase A